MVAALVLTAGVAVVAAMLHRLARRAGLQPWLAGGLFVAILLRLGLDFHPEWEWSLLPLPSYASRQAGIIYSLGVWFAVAAAAQLPVRWNRTVLHVAAASCLALGFDSQLPPATGLGSGSIADARGHLRQSTMTTCGPSACAMAVAYFGIPVSERQAVLACRQRDRGVRLLQLAAGVTRLAPDLHVTITTDLPQGDAVLVAANAGGAHAVCVVLHSDRAVLHDPLADGPIELRRAAVGSRLRSPYVVLRGAGFSAPTPGPCDPIAARSPRR